MSKINQKVKTSVKFIKKIKNKSRFNCKNNFPIFFNLLNWFSYILIQYYNHFFKIDYLRLQD